MRHRVRGATRDDYPGYMSASKCEHGCPDIDPLAHYSMVCPNITLYQLPG